MDTVPEALEERQVMRFPPEVADELIAQHFPHRLPNGDPSYRIHQRESIKKAITTDKKFVVINAPVGYGKTVAAYVFSKAFEKGVYLTPQKSLQEQILNERWSGVFSLKGANSYSCVYANNTQLAEIIAKGTGEIKCGFEDTSSGIKMCKTSNKTATNPSPDVVNKLIECGDDVSGYIKECAENMADAFFNYVNVGKSFRSCTSMDISKFTRKTPRKEIVGAFKRFYSDLYGKLVRKDGWIEPSRALLSFLCPMGMYECPKASAITLMKLASVRVFNPDLYSVYKKYGIYPELIMNPVMVFDEAHAIEDIVQRIYRTELPVETFKMALGLDLTYLKENSRESVGEYNNTFKTIIKPVYLIVKTMLSEFHLLKSGRSRYDITQFDMSDVINDENAGAILDFKKYAFSIASDSKKLNLIKDVIVPALSSDRFYRDKTTPYKQSDQNNLPIDYRVANMMNMYRSACMSYANAAAKSFSEILTELGDVRGIVNRLWKVAQQNAETFFKHSDTYRDYKKTGVFDCVFVDHLLSIKSLFNKYYDNLDLVYRATCEIDEESGKVPFIFNVEETVPDPKYSDKSDITKHYIDYHLQQKSKMPHVSIVPINTAFLMKHTFYSMSEKILLMSGTWIGRGEVFEIFGIPEDDVEYIEIPPIFDSRRRPVIAIDRKDYMNFSHKIPKHEQARGIYYKYQTPSGVKEWVAQLSYEIKNLRKFIEVKNGVPNANIILHTATISVRNLIVENMPGVDESWLVQTPNAQYKIMKSLVNQHQFEFMHKDDLIQYLMRHPNTGLTLVCYSMNEGIDFKHGAARGQIIVKCPTPNFGDPYIQARVRGSEVAGVKADNEYFTRKILITLTQQYGRVVRSMDDWGYTLLFDQEIVKRVRAICHPARIKYNRMDGLEYLISGTMIKDYKMLKFMQLPKVI